MPKVLFYGGPYDGKEADLPFLPTLLIGEEMGLESNVNGKIISTKISEATYIYQLLFPNGEDEPFLYHYRSERPSGFNEWFPAYQGPDPPPKDRD